jgi:hypothetical protein
MSVDGHHGAARGGFHDAEGAGRLMPRSRLSAVT